MLQLVVLLLLFLPYHVDTCLVVRTVGPCKCSPIESYGEEITVGNGCSLQFYCDSDIFIDSTNQNTLTLQKDDAVNFSCRWTPESSSFNWFYNGLFLNSPEYYCLEPEEKCNCPYVNMDKTNILQTVGRFHPSLLNITDYLFQAPDSNGGGACPEVFNCPENYTLLVFHNSSATLFPDGLLVASCSETTNKWTMNGMQMDNLYSVCVNYNLDQKRGCLCPLIPGQDGTGKKGDRYYSPLITYGDNCQAEFSCAGAGVDSYITVLYNEFNSPVFINRVVDGVSLSSSPEPRTVPGLQCLDFIGNFWMYIDFADYGIMASCYDDSFSCLCPLIPANDHAGRLATLKNRSSGDQCGFVEVECPDGYVPTLLSDATYAKPITAQGKPVFNELICYENDGVFSWYYADIPLVYPTISCAPRKSSCLCEDIVVIRTDEELSHYYTGGLNPHIVETPWNFTGCVSSIALTCSGTPFIFSNELSFYTASTSSNVLQCIPSPMDEDVYMWFFDGYRAVNPAIACI